MTIKKNIFKNALPATLEKVLRVSEQLILVPFFIKFWGAGYYGDWLTISVIPSLMSFADIGFGSSASNRFILQYLSSDIKSAKNTLKTAFLSMSVLIIIGFLLTFLIILTLNHFDVFEKLLIKKEDAEIALIVLMITKLIGFFTQIYEGLFRAARKSHLSLYMQSIYYFVIISSTLFVLLTGGGVKLYVFITFLITFLYVPFYGFLSVRTLDFNFLREGVFSKKELKNILFNGFGYLLSPIWQSIFFQGSTLAVRIALGPVAVTIFNTSRSLVRSINQAYSLVISSVYPEFQFAVGKKDFSNAKRIYKSTFVIVTLISILGAIFYLFFGNSLYELWTSKSIVAPKLMWYIYTLGIVFNSFWCTSIIVFQAFNQPYSFTFPSTVLSIASVLLTYTFSLNFGLSGAVMGNVFFDLALSIYIFSSSCRLIGLTFKSLTLEFINLPKRIYLWL